MFVVPDVARRRVGVFAGDGVSLLQIDSMTAFNVGADLRMTDAGKRLSSAFEPARFVVVILDPCADSGIASDRDDVVYEIQVTSELWKLRNGETALAMASNLSINVIELILDEVVDGIYVCLGFTHARGGCGLTRPS